MVYPEGYLLLVYERVGTSLVNVQEKVREKYDCSLQNDLRGVTEGHVKDKRTSQFYSVILIFIYKRWSVYTPWSDIAEKHHILLICISLDNERLRNKHLICALEM